MMIPMTMMMILMTEDDCWWLMISNRCVLYPDESIPNTDVPLTSIHPLYILYSPSIHLDSFIRSSIHPPFILYSSSMLHDDDEGDDWGWLMMTEANWWWLMMISDRCVFYPDGSIRNTDGPLTSMHPLYILCSPSIQLDSSNTSSIHPLFIDHATIYWCRWWLMITDDDWWWSLIVVFSIQIDQYETQTVL
jgi:hypothetical protein